jgi:c-di-GMP-binding flagellar brake protein YcgR
MAERRKAIRIPAKIKFTYEVLDSKGVPETRRSALTKNISARGLLFESVREIPIGTKIKFNLGLPGTPPRFIQTEAEVVRIERLLVSHNFDI